MTKAEFISALQAGFTEECDVLTTEVSSPESGERPISGAYSLITLGMALDFFSSNYDEGMVRQVHGTRILSLDAFRPKPPEQE
jgi:hypothetical protein